MEINIYKLTGTFAENKDTAAKLRKEIIEPTLNRGERIIIDFKRIDSSTQSFIHALISNSFQKIGEEALNLFEFKNCSQSVKTLITAVINYSLE
jgi:hypothetical protein